MAAPAALAASLLALTILAPPATASAQARKGGPPDLVKRGEYLVTVGSCNDCHTPWRLDSALGMPVPDMSRMLSGHPADGPDPESALAGKDQLVMGPTMTSFRLPFGTVYAANLTPDATGLQAWTEEQFVRAMRTGRKMGIAEGPPILPPMPWPSLARATDEDLRAIYAYLRAIPAIANAVPQNEVDAEAVRGIAAAASKLAPSPKPSAAGAR
jgi:mono/diheme cytochrome c family protein